jgi:hypothetical protein
MYVAVDTHEFLVICIFKDKAIRTWNIKTVCGELTTLDQRNFRIKREAVAYAKALYGELQTVADFNSRGGTRRIAKKPS